MNMGLMTGWQRIEHDNTPIYIRPDVPDWFVPNQTADEALLKLLGGERASGEIKNLLKRIDGPAGLEYQSRSDQIGLDTLEEC